MNQDAYRKLMQALGMVSQVFLMSLAGFAVGYGLDRVIVRTKPWLSILLAFAGMVFGFVRLYRWYSREADG